MSRQTQWEIGSCESSESSENSESESFPIFSSFPKHSWFPAFVWHSDIIFFIFLIFYESLWSWYSFCDSNTHTWHRWTLSCHTVTLRMKHKVAYIAETTEEVMKEVFRSSSVGISYLISCRHRNEVWETRTHFSHFGMPLWYYFRRILSCPANGVSRWVI